MDTCTSPIELGSALVTMVEPHRGHEIAYNRWYERDHFYSGCMIGPYQFSGGRFVAPRRLKALRYPPDSEITPDPMVGSYLALYWVLARHHREWNRWAMRQVKELHKAGRMFPHRTHVHTQLYTYAWGAFRDADPVPPELVLDHPYKGLVAVWGRAPDRDAAYAWYRDGHLPRMLRGSPAASCLAFSPIPMPSGAPSDVPSSTDDDERFLLLFFCEEDPQDVWDDTFAGHRSDAADVLLVSPFVPTIPGTDTYTDELW